MNKQRLQGTVSFIQISAGEKNGRQWKKASWTLGTKHGNNYNNLNCSTFDWEIIDALYEGMVMELTDYLPVNKSYKKENPMTGLEEKKSFYTLEVYDFIPLGSEETTSSGKMFKQAMNQQPQPQAKFDVAKAYADSKYMELKKEANNQVADGVEKFDVNENPDWMEELVQEQQQEKKPKVAPALTLEQLQELNSNYTNSLEQDHVIEVGNTNEKNPW